MQSTDTTLHYTTAEKPYYLVMVINSNSESINYTYP